MFALRLPIKTKPTRSNRQHPIDYFDFLSSTRIVQRGQTGWSSISEIVKYFLIERTKFRLAGVEQLSGDVHDAVIDNKTCIEEPPSYAIATEIVDLYATVPRIRSPGLSEDNRSVIGHSSFFVNPNLKNLVRYFI